MPAISKRAAEDPGASWSSNPGSGSTLGRTVSPNLSTLVFLSMGLSACEQTLDPIEHTDMAYSIFGYLDASSDIEYPNEPTNAQGCREG